MEESATGWDFEIVYRVLNRRISNKEFRMMKGGGGIRKKVSIIRGLP